MSLETTKARAELNHREQQWKDHCVACSACALVARRRNGAESCTVGIGLLDDVREAKKALTWNRQEDKKPIAGQESLF